MNKYFLCISSLLFYSTFFTNAQSNKYLKLIDEQKYSKVEKKLSKKYEKESDDLELNYTYAVLYTERDYKSYEPYKSYDYIVKAIEKYYDLTKEIQAKYNKDGFSIEALSKQKEKCYEQAFDDCKQGDVVECYKRYISFFKDAENWKIKAQRSIYEKAYSFAEAEKTTTSYMYFIDHFNELNFHSSFKQSEDLLKKAWEKVYILEFEKAKVENTVQGYQRYIDAYPFSHLLNDAKTKRNELAFAEAKNLNTIDSYQNFINKYPDAIEKTEAIRLRDEIAFNDAKKLNNSQAFKNFILHYSKSTLLAEAKISLEKCLYDEVTKTSNVNDYWYVLNEYPESSNASLIKDSLFSIIIQQHLMTEMAKYVDEYGFSSNNDTLQIMIKTLIQDGDHNTIYKYYELFSDKWPQDIQDEIKQTYEQLKKVFDLHLDIGVKQFNQGLYESFIIKNAPKEIAFVCVQRLAEKYLINKDWTNAITVFKKYKSSFLNMTERFNKIIEILEKKEKEIIIESLSQINSLKDDYSPVITYDSKKMYFCSKGREDGLGGEDIYTSEWVNGKWTKPVLFSELSTAEGNEAPLAVSADGNIILLWKNDNKGDIFYSINTKYGWGAPQPFPYPINTEYYEGDASFTADGKGLIFVSSRPGGFNVSTETQYLYHGDNEHQTDIYISLKNINGKWLEPINLGNQINTPFAERTPFLHPDGRTLYFSSDCHYGLGKADVYMTQSANDSTWTNWATPINMGKYINTATKDWGFKFTTDGEYVFYSANKKKMEMSSLILVLDISGSMQGEKLKGLKVAALDACKTALQNNCEIAIVSFPGSYQNPYFDVLNFTEDFNSLSNYILNLNANGGTPMFEAILEANKFMIKNKSKYSKNTMFILMSDGDANGNMDMNDFLSALMVNNVTKMPHQCIALEVNEYSQAYQDLTKIAQLSGGKFIFAKSYSELNNAFAEATSSLYDFSLTKNSGKDIYSFKMPDHLKPDYVATISGKLVDKSNNPIQAKISWEDLETSKIMGESNSNPVDGSFYIILPLGKIYGYYIDNNELFPISNNIDLRNNKKATSVEQNIDVVTFKEMVEQGIAVPINNLFFNFGESGLLDESLPELKRVANIIIKNGLKVEISGHTDDIGNEKQNQLLSETRANNVKDYLIKQGCDPSIFTIIGYGATRNIADNSTDEGRKKNRRVELRFLK
jgi:outer membrane protein OmpA-like peptidoglycan-associated protein/uncharacterized protein YegL